MTTFKNIKLHNEVLFENNNKTYRGLVVDVKKNTFTVNCLMCYTNEKGHKSFYEQYFNFMKKSGKKANHRNTYGNAISFEESLSQQLENTNNLTTN